MSVTDLVFWHWEIHRVVNKRRLPALIVPGQPTLGPSSMDGIPLIHIVAPIRRQLALSSHYRRSAVYKLVDPLVGFSECRVFEKGRR